jgi:hypothetical protein
MACVIDIQGYINSEQRLIPKEIVVCSQSKTVQYIVKPPKSLWQFNRKDRSLINWATHKYHYIPWYSGDTHFNEIPYLVYFEALPFKKVYTKGREKAVYLTELLAREVVDLTDLGCPSLRKKQTSPCANHTEAKAHCALANAKEMLQWIATHLEKP